MKKAVSLLLAAALVLGNGFSVSAAVKTKAVQPKAVKPVMKEVSGEGVIKAFDEKSITLIVGGKSVTYTVDDGTKVHFMEEEAYHLDVVKKGLKVQFKALGDRLTHMEVPDEGLQSQGVLGLHISDTRENITDSPIVPAASPVLAVVHKEAGEETDTSYVYKDTKTLNIGDVVIVPDSLSVSLNGKQLKVIEGKTEFDKSVEGDEVKLVLNKTFYSLEFEKPFAEKAPTQEELEKMLKVTYRKKIFYLTTTEITNFPINEDVYVELNGQETSFIKALNRGTYAFIRTNLDGEIIYIDAFYKDLVCRVDKIEYDKITFSVVRNEKTAFTDTLRIAYSATIRDEKGASLDYTKIQPGTMIKISVDPYENYKIIDIAVMQP